MLLAAETQAKGERPVASLAVGCIRWIQMAVAVKLADGDGACARRENGIVNVNVGATNWVPLSEGWMGNLELGDAGVGCRAGGQLSGTRFRTVRA